MKKKLKHLEICFRVKSSAGISVEFIIRDSEVQLILFNPDGSLRCIDKIDLDKFLIKLQNEIDNEHIELG